MKKPIAAPAMTGPWGRQLAQWAQDVSNTVNDQQIGQAIASASTISPSYPIHHVTGTATIQTINMPAGMTGPLHLIPDGVWALGTSGNIAKASTAVVGQVMHLHYDPTTSKWYPSY